MTRHKLSSRSMSRRDALGTLGAIGVVSLLGSRTRAVQPVRAAGIDGACTLTPELTIGPYFVDERLELEGAALPDAIYSDGFDSA
jgi:hypothetical protein